MNKYSIYIRDAAEPDLLVPVRNRNRLIRGSGSDLEPKAMIVNNNNVDL